MRGQAPNSARQSEPLRLRAALLSQLPSEASRRYRRMPVQRIARPLVLMLGLFAVGGTALGKCPTQEYRIEGRVEVPDGLDARSIRIYAFLDGVSTTTEAPLLPGEPEYATPAADGTFAFSSWLHTDSGVADGRASRGKDRCRRKADSVDVVALGDGVRAHRVRARFMRLAGQPPTARVPSIVFQEDRPAR